MSFTLGGFLFRAAPKRNSLNYNTLQKHPALNPPFKVGV